MSNQPKAAKRRWRDKIARKFFYKNNYESLGSWKKRIFDLLTTHRPWYDWGHRGMILFGQDHGGNWSEPNGPTWYYRPKRPDKRMWRTGYPITRLLVVKSYDEWHRVSKELGIEHDDYDWRVICMDSDDDLKLGRGYWGEPFYGLHYVEMRLLLRYLLQFHVFVMWFGARKWLYQQSLNAAVYMKKPFACNTPPDRDSGGYSHWYCQEKKGHDLPHRYNNYIWNGPGTKVEHIGDKDDIHV